MGVVYNLAFLLVGITPCALSPASSASSGSCVSCCCNPMYFGFFGHCRWDVCCPAHLFPLLVQDIIPETYNPNPLTISYVLYRKQFAEAVACQGGFWRGISMCQIKAYLNSSLYISAPYWDLVRKASHPPPSQACYILCLDFLPRVDFRSLRPLSLLYTLISCPFSHSSLT